MGKVESSRDLHLIHLVQETIDEIAGLPGLPPLPVVSDLFRDEDSKLLEVLEDSVVRARNPIQERRENVVCLERQES